MKVSVCAYNSQCRLASGVTCWHLCGIYTHCCGWGWHFEKLQRKPECFSCPVAHQNFLCGAVWACYHVKLFAPKTVDDVTVRDARSNVPRHTIHIALDDASTLTLLLQLVVSWVNDGCQSEQNYIPFGHLLKVIWTVSFKIWFEEDSDLNQICLQCEHSHRDLSPVWLLGFD